MDHGSITHEIVSRVAARKGVGPSEIEPLYTAIDPDALEAMFDDADGSVLRDGRLSFRYEGFTVRVSDDGTVDLGPIERN